MFEESDQLIRVSVGIIKKNDKYLLCQRAINRRYALRWEFPGGKRSPDESPAECLVREINEELSLEPTKFKELTTIRTSYPDGGNFLITYFIISDYTGELKNKVFEKVEWVTSSDLKKYDIIEGTLPILRFL